MTFLQRKLDRKRGALAALALLAGLAPHVALAQSSTSAPTPSSRKAAPPSVVANEIALDQLTQSNLDLLDLLKKQQAVLEDIQFDRRLQSRQISSLEERLVDTLKENEELRVKVAKLETQLATMPAPSATPAPSSAAPTSPAAVDTPATPPAPPATYLQPPEPDNAPGTKWWHRLFTLSGTDGKTSDVFHIQGRQWRVIWHNQDHPGTEYANTSALFISAFPKGDTVPQKVCSKLGSGGDITELDGPGNFYLKIEASGGSWELAVEDFK
jgi:hypothetical protein